MEFSDIVSALEKEREFVNTGFGFEVLSAVAVDGYISVGIEPLKSKRVTAIDDSLEGCRAVWGKNREYRGEVFIANPDDATIVLRRGVGPLPNAGQLIWLYPRDFLTPLIDLWSDRTLRNKAVNVAHQRAEGAIQSVKPLPSVFKSLRERQSDALGAALYRSSLIFGPPGTGKTFTVGALIAYLLVRFGTSRIILTGPTNVAVDTALIAADDWLERIGRPDLRQMMKRAGAHLDSKKYLTRKHLLAPGLQDAVIKLAVLELEEPQRSEVGLYSKWREAVERVRSELKSDIGSLVASSRVIGVTTASAFIWRDALMASGRWHFGICDESSQVIMPAALMIGTMAQQVIFAGDPNQLAPVVQNPATDVQALLTLTAFDVMKNARQVKLNEQSRMSVGLCDAVSSTFYDGELRVCALARKDKDWIKERSPWFVNGREIPRIMFDDRAAEAQWSRKYGGMIRFSSAKIIEGIVNELLGSYVAEKEILVLTPFRAQRAFLRTLFRRDPLRGVRISTVHRAQGSENRIVIFDPVEGAGRFLNSEHGKRLINVAISRAQAHAIIVVNAADLANPWLKSLHQRASKIWHRAGDYAHPLRIVI